jgi:hypothetical protein
VRAWYISTEIEEWASILQIYEEKKRRKKNKQNTKQNKALGCCHANLKHIHVFALPPSQRSNVNRISAPARDLKKEDLMN